MAEEQMSSEPKLSDLTLQSFRHTLDLLHDRASSILFLTRHWKDIDVHLRSAHDAIEDRARELRGIEESVRERVEEVERREADLEVRVSEVEERENAVNEKLREIELLNVKFEEESRKREENLEKRLKEFYLKEKQLEEQYKELRLKDEYLERQFTELQSKEKKLEEESKQFKLKEEKLEQHLREVQLKARQVVEENKEDEFLKKNFAEQLKKQEQKVEEQFKELKSKEKQLEERCREVELKEKQLESRYREVELKEKKVVDTLNTRVKSEPSDQGVMYPSADVSLSFCVKMDGMALQIFLNERWKDHDSLRDEVTMALQLSSDPAKLVLDAIQGFYPPFLKKGEMEFKEDVIRRSCILLLEQLMKISPQVRPDVRKEAMKIAFDWMTKMRADAGHSLEVLGLLQLLASYGLASAFDPDELLNYLQIVAHRSRAPELLRVLGLTEKISGFIQNLISKNQRIEAVQFVYAFELVYEFPPVPLLKEYLNESRITAKRTIWKNKSLKAEFKATNKRLVDLKAVLRCVEHHKIKSDLSPKLLKQQIYSLQKQNSYIKMKLRALDHKAKSADSNQKKQLTPNVSVAVAPKIVSTTNSVLISPSSASTADPASKHLSPQKRGLMCPWTAVSAGDDPTAMNAAAPRASSELSLSDRTTDSSSQSPHPLRNSISEEFSKSLLLRHGNSDLAHGENSKLLEHEPAKSVLDTIKSLFPLDEEGDKDFKSVVSEGSCILLLEQLRKVSLQIGTQVKEEALNFAAEWKKKLIKKRHVQSEVVIFLEFLVTYELVPSCTFIELFSLLDTNPGHKKVSDLCQVLGLVDKIPDFVESLINKNQRIEAVKYIYLLKVDNKFPPVQLLHDHLSYSKKNAEELIKKDNNSITAQIAAIVEEIAELRSVINCIATYNLESEFSPDSLRDRIGELEKLKEVKGSKFDQSTAVSISPTAVASATLTTAPANTLFAATSLSSAAGPNASTSVTPPPSTIAPPIATVSETQLEHVKKKRRRVVISSGTPSNGFSVESGVCPVQHFDEPPYMAPARHYGLTGQRPTNPQFFSYSDVNPCHCRNPDYVSPPMPMWRP